MAVNKTSEKPSYCSYYCAPKVFKEPGTPFQPKIFAPPPGGKDVFLDRNGKVVPLTPQEADQLHGKKENRNFFMQLIDWLKSILARLFG